MKLEELAEHHIVKLAHLLPALTGDGTCILPSRQKWDVAEVRKFVKQAEKLRLDWRPGPGKVSLTYYVMTDESAEIFALGLMRFPLENETETDGGNLVVEVPVPLRKQNHGSVCLSLLLFEAVRAGLRRVFVTCPEHDPAARRVIEKNRGALLDIVPSTRKDRKGVSIARHWIQFR